MKYATFSPLFYWACILVAVALLPVAELPSGIVKAALAALLFTLAILALLFSIGPEFVTRRDAVVANRYKARAQGMAYASEPIGFLLHRVTYGPDDSGRRDRAADARSAEGGLSQATR